jgi:hypothetical protein
MAQGEGPEFKPQHAKAEVVHKLFPSLISLSVYSCISLGILKAIILTYFSGKSQIFISLGSVEFY